MKKDSFLRAFASQHTILYNRGKKPVCDSWTMISCKTHVESLISSKFPWCNQIINEVLVWLLFLNKYLYFLVEVFIKVSIQSVLVMNVEEEERFVYVWLLYLPIPE